jgi:hypothetical protein
MTQQARDEFKTTDLALATMLHMNGLTFKLSRIGSTDQVMFTFKPLSDNEARDMEVLVGRFKEREARVEPLKFLKEVSAVRNRLYAFLDGNSSDAE